MYPVGQRLQLYILLWLWRKKASVAIINVQLGSASCLKKERHFLWVSLGVSIWEYSTVFPCHVMYVLTEKCTISWGINYWNLCAYFSHRWGSKARLNYIWNMAKHTLKKGRVFGDQPSNSQGALVFKVPCLIMMAVTPVQYIRFIQGNARTYEATVVHLATYYKPKQNLSILVAFSCPIFSYGRKQVQTMGCFGCISSAVWYWIMSPPKILSFLRTQVWRGGKRHFIWVQRSNVPSQCKL